MQCFGSVVSAEQPQCHSYSKPMEPSGEGFALDEFGQKSRLKTSLRGNGAAMRVMIGRAMFERRKKSGKPRQPCYKSSKVRLCYM